MRTAPNPQNLKVRQKGVLITYKGISMTAAHWADHKGIKRTTLQMRLSRGMSVHEALTRPVFKNGRILIESPIRSWYDSVPKKTEGFHPVVTAIYREMKHQRCTYRMLSKRSGVSISAICALKRNGPGYFVNVEALVTTLDLVIKVVRTHSKEDV